MMTPIQLHGDLGRKFGKDWNLDVRNPAEALRALFANRPDMKAYFQKRAQKGYRIFVGADTVSQDADRLDDPSGGRLIRIVPITHGGKSQGVGQIIMGAVLFVVGAVLSYFGAGAGAPLMNMGIAMMVGGVAQLLFAPGAPGAPDERPENKPSYNFAGPVNTTAQGHPVAVGYGRLIVGGAVINAGIISEAYNRGASGGGWGGGGSGGTGVQVLYMD